MDDAATLSLLSDECEQDELTSQGNTVTIKRSNKYLPLASCVAALGGILFGYDIGIISGALLQLKGEFKLSCSKQEMIVTSLLIGGLIASIFGGQIVDYFGRRKAIIVNSFFFIGGALVLAFSHSFAMLIVGRLLLGFAVSLSAIGECIYISEIATPARRGSLVSLNELGITLGILIAYLVNHLLIKLNHGWRIMFGLSSIPALLQGIGMMLLPSSPRWLISKDKKESALKVIKMLWPNVDATDELEKIKKSISGEKEFKLLDLVSKKQNLRQRMIIGCGIVFFQQITGQPTVLYYAPAVFFSIGFNSSTSATMATVGLGVVKVIFTGIALLKVDKFGRRLFLLIGAVTMTTSIIILSAVTQPIQHLHSHNPCEKNVISAGHTHVSHPALYPRDHCPSLKILNISKLDTNASIIPSNMPQHFTLKGSRIQSKNNTTLFEQNCTRSSKSLLKAQVSVAGSVKYVCLIALMAFVAGYAVGYGPVSWLFLTEIFPVGIKGRAVAVATIFNWGTNIFISMTFLEVIGSIGPSWTFLIYSITGILSILFIFHFVPETKQKSLEQISEELNKRSTFCSHNSNCCKRSQRLQVPVPEDDLERENSTNYSTM